MDAFGYYPYDAEGVKTRKNVLVKDGILTSLMVLSSSLVMETV